MKGYNCSQSVLAGLAPVLNITEREALTYASGFGAGFGRMREVCGAFSGITAAVGLYYADPDDPQDKSRIYAIVQQLADAFRQNNPQHTLICRELLGSAADTSPAASQRTAAYYASRPCESLVVFAAGLAQSYFSQHPQRAYDPNAAE